MSDLHSSIGKIGWVDLTVEKAGEVRNFYSSVTGWETSDVSMGEYNDYCMHPSGAVAGLYGE